MARHQLHSMAKDVIWRAVKRAKIPAHKVPRGLVLQNAKDRMEPRLYRDPGAKRWRGTSLSLTHTRHRT